MNKGFLFAMVGAIIFGLIAVGLVIMIFADNVKNADAEGGHDLYIPTGADYNAVRSLLVQGDIIKDIRSLDWVAEKMHYPQTIEPGKYHIEDHHSNRSLVTLLRNGLGEQEIAVTINNIHRRPDLFLLISERVEADSLELALRYEDEEFLAPLGFTRENAWATVLADTYKFHWDTDAEGFFGRMLREFRDYWNEERTARAENLGLSPMDCIILASIIEKESNKLDEYRRIAGVYVNRLRKDWPLQADPTVKFALDQPGIKRVLKVHLEVDSPYNTYKNTGLPPGPIGLPEKTSIEAVLAAEPHDYMYFCAREDFSGYHVFARTLKEHRRNARKYQRALDKNGIN